MKKFAIIDLGSNSARMTISEIHPDGSYTVLERMQEMVRLSNNMGPKKVLQKPEIERTLKALDGFNQAIHKYDDITVRAVATAAVRQATNQAKFLELVQTKVGLTLEVLTGEQEAHYDYLGVINTLNVSNTLILDTGGASSELIFVVDKESRHEVSIPVGAVNISEKFLEKDKISAAALFQAFTAVDERLNSISWLRQAHEFPLVVLGGSNRTLGKISRRAKHIQDTPLHGYRISSDEAFGIYTDILSKDLEERRKIAGLAKERGDIIVGGLMPLMALLRYVDANKITFSQAGIREGILFEKINEFTGEAVIDPEPAALTVDIDD
ncbi:Ppx/GppA family phosphatase [Periweissella fabalis]|uniref:Ppx/GppA family phosphatase n=1 Tax=Periweissella fabalis TaxID=1070421 RepID=A0A7X6N028_9LACO|nr:Ppx/GppA family phosphatase [Periweissella fabalis]MCM0599043.1 Ppx/GppA family phosphatase [Periweissella fabalis]NKZ23323.1 Ppx/GppA family phosphatase [Periweissella fabalis]